MTVNEFIEELNRLGATGDDKLCIQVVGVLGASGVEVTSVAKGFDWNKGRLILNTEKNLSILQPVKRKDNQP